ncbi:PAS domain S-box protein [Gramella sp. GC03-9]|uniref:histidine kinase n=1 Tax=Christiangramia oceanisediminis TaxID=2920386 RepID=A0A9X2KW70_9FLAO|nr:PAS domain S-box protein [Gramella oceanisediminis]MCP9199917.1 PAS domain S-box protein [Gramella oceanisediminis]
MNEETPASHLPVHPVISLDTELKVIAFNEEAGNFFTSIFREISTSSCFISFFPDLERPCLYQKLVTALSGRIQIFDYLYNSKTIQFHITPVPDENMNYSRLVIAIEHASVLDKTVYKERKMLRAIIDNIPDYIFVKDRNHKSILTNRKFHQNILGKETEELGYTPYDYLETEKAEKIVADNERVMESGLPVINRPDIVISKQGKEERVLLTKVPLRDTNDEISGLVGIARDITSSFNHQKKQELVLEIIKSFAESENLAEALGVVISLLCKELDFDYAEAYKANLGQDKFIKLAVFKESKIRFSDWKTKENEPAYQSRFWDLDSAKVYSKVDRELVELSEYAGEQLKTGVGFPILFKGKQIAFIFLGSKNVSKEIKLDLMEGVSLQIAAAIMNKRSQDQFNDFFKYSLNLIAVLGTDNFIKLTNPSFENKFGYSQRELLSIPFIEFIHPDDLEKVNSAIKGLSVDDSEFEIRCKRKDGIYLWVSWRFSRFFEDENVVYAFGTDITPIKEVNAKLTAQILQRKQIQRDLEISEENYRKLFENSPLPMWVLDRQNLKFLSVNKAAVKLYGYSEQEFKSMTVRDLWVPGQETRLNKLVDQNREVLFKVETQHLTKDGQRLYVAVKSSPLLFDGRRSRVSHVTDITAMVLAEKKLLYSEQRFRSLVQEGSDLISIVDGDFKFLYNSPASFMVFGKNSEELNTTNFLDYVHQEDLQKLKLTLQKLQQNKRLQLPSYRIKLNDKGWRWIETIVTDLNHDPAVGGIVLNSRDITEFIVQEKKVKQSLKRYDIVSKATSDIITDHDLENDVVEVNKAASKMLGYSREEIGNKGAWWDDKIHPEDREEVKRLASKMRKDGLRQLSTEYRVRCANGSYKYILDRSYLLTDDNNKPKRIIGSMQDITERKQHLIAIKNHNKRLKEIAWTQSHVVRAPLAKVMGLVDLLIHYRDNMDNVDDLLNNILISAQELDAIIRKISIETEKEL